MNHPQDTIRLDRPPAAGRRAAQPRPQARRQPPRPTPPPPAESHLQQNPPPPRQTPPPPQGQSGPRPTQPPQQAPPPPQGPPAPPQGQGNGKGNGNGKGKKGCGCGCLLPPVLLILLLLAAFFAYWQISAHKVPQPVKDLPIAEQRSEAMHRATANIHLLLAGDDERAGDEAARSDTIIYTVLRPVDKKIEMVAIPRDSLVEIPGHGKDKANAALALGGMPLMMKTVEHLTGRTMDHTVLVNFDSFSKIVDAMGGVTIDVPVRMHKPEENIDLQPGRQHLNGSQALAFVRWRDDGQGDLGRIERQRTFMQAALAKGRHLMPWQAVRVAMVLKKEVKTDLSLVEWLGIVHKMAGIGSDDLEYHHFMLNPQYIDGVSYVLLDPADVQAVVSRMNYGVDLNALPG